MKKLSEEQRRVLSQLGLSEKSDEIEIEEKVSELLQKEGFDGDYAPTETGRICESILDELEG